MLIRDRAGQPARRTERHSGADGVRGAARRRTLRSTPSAISMRLHVLTAALLALGLTSCDGSSDETPASFSGVPVTPVGGATLRAEGGALVVSGIAAGAEGGFSVPGPTSGVDVEIDPVRVPDGGRFGGRVEDAAGAELASIFAEGDPDDRVRLVFSLGAASDVRLVRIVYRFGGQTLFTIPELPVTANARLATALLVRQNAGDGSGETGSVHFVRDGGRWVMASDSPSGGARGTAQRGADCRGFLVRPPVAAGPDLLCTDYVEITPLTGQAEPAARTAILARGLGGFTVRTLSTR